MRYEIPLRMEADLQAQALPRWPQGIGGGLAAELDDGAAVSVPVPEGVNILTVGVTGTGKTRSFTAPAAALLLSDPQRKAVFFELKATYANRFFRPGDKLISYQADGLPPRALFRWNMIREIRQSADREAEIRQISEFLFREQLTAAGQNLSWIAAARDTFSGVLRVVVDCTRENTSNRELIGALRQQSVSDLLSYLAAHPQNHGLLKRIYGYDSASAKGYQPTRRSGDVMFFLHTALEQFSGAFCADGQDTIHDFLRTEGQNLFLVYDLASAEISRPFMVYFLKKLKDEKLSNRCAVSAPLLMVLDEVDKLADGGRSADFGLFQAATLGREAGLQLLLTTQSLEQLYGLAPQFNEHLATAGLAGFPMTVAFRPGDAPTLHTLQTLYGSDYRERTISPVSRYDRPATHCELEPLVSEAEFAALAPGTAYVKLADARPVKVRFLHRKERLP